MKKLSIYYLIPPLILFAGSLLLPLEHHLRLKGILSLPKDLNLLLMFILFSFLVAWALRFHKPLFINWSHINPLKFLFGSLLGVLPFISTHYYLHKSFHFNLNGLNHWNLLYLGLAVLWKEVWLRGISAESAGRLYGPIRASLLMSAFVLLLQLTQPSFNFSTSGAGLFFTNYLLFITYFYFGSIWASLGMHFSQGVIITILLPSFPKNHSLYISSLISVGVALTMAYYFRGRKKY